MNLGTRVHILDKAVCVSLCVDALEKGMNPSILPHPPVEQTGFFSLGIATGLGGRRKL